MSHVLPLPERGAPREKPDSPRPTTTHHGGAGSPGASGSALVVADGNLLIRRNTSGETVLYLGSTEVHLDTSTTTAKYWAQRYYSAGTTTIALRTNKSGAQTLSYLSGDPHGTSTLSLDATTQAVTKRYLTPFGGTRTGGIGPWPDDKTFLGKTTDTTSGLTYIGARQYDPNTGRFISVDPVLDTTDAQSLNGYTYADNNPVTASDPTGLWLDDGTGHSEPRGGGNPGSNVGVPRGGTGPDGCYYTCGGTSNGTSGKSNNSGNSGNDGSGSNWLSSVTHTVINYSVAIFTEPDVWWSTAETVVGLGMMVGGGMLAESGVAVCATGVLCVIGAPAAALGATAIAGGGYTAVAGANNIGKGINKALNEARVDSSATGGAESDVSLYKAPGKGMTEKIMKDGFDPEDFPGTPGDYPDGSAYFGVEEKGKEIALDYASRGYWDSNVVQIRIPKADFDKHFAEDVAKYDGIPGAQAIIPKTKFEQLNKYPRSILGD
ncbi:hypothetical protein GCM10010259_60740 [Streptomyces daghestanicus]|uniref:RHS repeat-associated core domain-containing protein n=2 Tax=Streptomyces TaxID=1883 RepID=A0A918GW49_STRGD|nr:hypothetical protein GCM10010238_61150 [Streptomyces niveoruber]GGT21000.1 hypothetical protein GCM10010240_62330 [Streptomyces griseoviridis]GGU61919.1 hypothetical protein GCM10010259_60740 [Streptomyces daghestanicus]GHI30415.1 hypothetical protein Sdagh_21450 [Streptomyces daghestanicus]